MIDIDVPVSYHGESDRTIRPALPHEARSLYATARVLETVAAFYLQFPTHDMLDMVCHEPFDGLSPHVLEPLEEFRSAACTSDLDTCGAEYARLFLETNAPCPLWESAWTGHESFYSPTHDDVLAWYARHQKIPICAPYEPADHIAVELAFAATLAWFAIDGADVDADYETFIRTRLAAWVPRFAQVLRQHARVGLYQRLAALTLAVLSIDLVVAPR